MTFTVSDSVPLRQYTSNGSQTAFAVPFEFRTDSDIVVRIDGAIKTLNTDYTLTGAGITGGGTCTFSVAPANLAVVSIYRDMPIARGTEQYNAYGPLPGEVLEADLDDVTMKMQQVERDVARAIHLLPYDPASAASFELPLASMRANRFMRFDANGALELAVSIGSTILTSSLIGTTLDSLKRTDAEIAAGVTPTNFAYEPGDVRRYGATGDGTTDDTTALQNALLCNHAVKIPNGTHRITASLEIDDDTEIVFESRQAVIKGNLTAPLLRGRNGTTQRRFHIVIWSGKLDNTARTNAGGIGIDLLSTTMFKAFGTFITNVETGVRIGGTSAQGAYYNEFHGVDITAVDQGYELGTLGNENKVYGGRVNDCEIAVRLNNNTGNLFDGLACEVFTTYGFDVAPTTVTQYTRIINPRLENTPTSGTGVRVNAAAQSTMIIEPQCVGLTTNLSDSGTDTAVIATDKSSPRLRTRRIILAQNALDSTAHAQFYADASARVACRNGADSAYARLDVLRLTAAEDVLVVGSAAIAGAGEISYGSDTQTTVGAAGGASALPANPTGYIIVNVAGTNRVIPFYAAS